MQMKSTKKKNQRKSLALTEVYDTIINDANEINITKIKN